MSVSVTIFFAVMSGATYQACIKESTQAQVCVAANGVGKHDFVGLKEDTDFIFTYKQSGDESAPLAYHTQKKTPPAPNAVER